MYSTGDLTTITGYLILNLPDCLQNKKGADSYPRPFFVSKYYSSSGSA